MNIKQKLKEKERSQEWFMKKCREKGIGMSYNRIARIDQGTARVLYDEYEIINQILDEML